MKNYTRQNYSLFPLSRKTVPARNFERFKNYIPRFKLQMIEKTQKETWNNFILANGGSFLQTFEWGEFQESVGRRVFRFCSAKSTPSEVEGWCAQFIEMPLPFGKKYWHCPRGPVIADDKEQLAGDQVKKIIEEIKKKASDDVIFFRLGPEWDINNSYWPMANSLKGMGFKQLCYDIEPSQTLVLDITKTENELLAQMHEKWRYNIQLAKRKSLQIKFVTSDVVSFEHYFEEFYRLVDEGTSERKHIKHHPKDYYKKQLAINSQQVKFLLVVAELEEKVIAANIVVICGNRATYLHGATDNNERSLMAPHLLQWKQIEYAKSFGCIKYDFWGIVNEHTLDKRGQSWEGFTRFKKGFGGYEVNYIGYFDYPLSMLWHLMYRLVQKFRR